MTESNTHMCEGERLVIKRKGGGSIVSLPPVFSSDSRILYVTWGNCVRAYSTQTGSFLLEFSGLSHRCTSLQLLSESDSLASCSEKGEVIFWDCSSATIQEKRNLEVPYTAKVTGCHILGREKDIFVVLSKEQQKYQQMLRFKSSCKDFDEIKVKLNSSPNCFAVGGRENKLFLGAIHKCNVYALDVRKGKLVRLFVHSERRYTCIAAHKTEQILAVGGIDGCITIWSSIFNRDHPPRSIHHWHTLPVNAVCFSETGTSLFSGGGECVLVKWFLDYQDKSFLPRMGSPICHLAVAPGNQFVVASMADNSIQLISSQLSIEKVIQNFTWNVNIGNKETHYMGMNKMRFDPRTKSLVLNGLSGHLQFFSAYSNSLLHNLDVVGQNFLTQERNETIYNTEVMHVAFSCNGSWMATIELRKDPDSSLESRLKFWRFNEEKQNFGLNTCIESPHIGEIHALEMKPGTEDFFEVMAVTSGDDEKFKIWTLVDNSAVNDEKVESSREVWHCESAGVYKGLPAGDVGFSSDGSILGAAFSYALTLWVPDTNELKASLTHPDYHHIIRKLQFGSGDCCHLIVSLLPECIVVWNILSLTMTWTVPMEVSILTADPLSSYMAAFSCSGDLVIFKPSEPQPVLVKPNLSENKILLAAFVPLTKPRSDLMKWQQKSQLYFMNEQQELLVLENREDNSKEGADGGAQGNLNDKSDLNLTAFGRMLASVMQVSEVKPIGNSDYSCDGIQGKEKIDELLRMPVHTMPPLHLICYPFLTSLVKKLGNGSKNEESGSEMEEDERMDDKDSESDSEINVKSQSEKSNSDKINLQDINLPRKVVRPKVESTPELEAHLQEVFNESTKWVKAL